MELRATRESDESSRNNSTFTDGEDEKVVVLFERVLSQFVPRSRRSRRRVLQNSHDELEARDDDNDDDGGIKSLIKDLNLIDVSDLHNTDERVDDDALTLKETTKITTTTNLAELHEQRENERVRSLAQTSSSTVRSALLDWDAHKQNVFMKWFAQQASGDAVLELNVSSWVDNSMDDEKQFFFRDYTKNINRNVEEKATGTPISAWSSRNETVNINIDTLFKNEDKFGDERLQELENASSSTSIARTTQRECVERLQKLNENIARAWLEADRVAALKLSIKVVKLLGYNAGGKAPEFYPILFFLVADIADTVGQLVYKRIKLKAENRSDEMYDDIEDGNRNNESKKAMLHENWNSDDVRDSAKATCRNWFFKIASIRELVPRLYLELALSDCMRFLHPEPPVDRLNRLITQIKGVGDPLVSSYLRCYAAKKVVTLLPQKFQKDALKTLLGDFVSRYIAISDLDESVPNKLSVSSATVSSLRRSGLRKGALLHLMNPALEWILARNAKLAETSTLERSINMCSNEFKGKPPLSFLSALYGTLSEEVCAENALRLVRLVKNSSSSNSFDVSDCANCFIVLGKAFAKLPPEEQYRLDILMEVWQVLGKWDEDQLENYAGVTDAFVDFVAENFTRHQLEILLKDLAKRVKKSRTKLFDGDEELAARRKIQGGNLAKNIENICTKILFRFDDVSLGVSLSGFSYLVDQLGGDSKVAFSRKMLECIKKSKHRLESNNVISHAFNGAKAVHDSVDVLTFKSASFDLVSSFVSKVHFDESDIDGELRFLAKCRSAFPNADDALIKVIRRSIAIVKRCVTMDLKNKSKMQAHAAASLAFFQITIPSVEDIDARLDLIVEMAKYATVGELHAQVDGVINSAIGDIKEAIESLSAERVHAFIVKLSEVLMDNPAGHPEYGSFYSITTLSTVLEKIKPDSIYKVYLYLSLAYVLSAFAETRGTLNKKNVLYVGTEQAFVDECCTMTKEMVSKAADVAFNDKLLSTVVGGCANIRIACAVFDLFEPDSRETKKTIQTLVRRAESSDLIASRTDSDADIMHALRTLKTLC